MVSGSTTSRTNGPASDCCCLALLALAVAPERGERRPAALDHLAVAVEDQPAARALAARRIAARRPRPCRCGPRPWPARLALDRPGARSAGLAGGRAVAGSARSAGLPAGGAGSASPSASRRLRCSSSSLASIRAAASSALRRASSSPFLRASSSAWRLTAASSSARRRASSAARRWAFVLGPLARLLLGLPGVDQRAHARGLLLVGERLQHHRPRALPRARPRPPARAPGRRLGARASAARRRRPRRLGRHAGRGARGLRLRLRLTSTATALLRPCEKLCRTTPLSTVFFSSSRPPGRDSAIRGLRSCSLVSVILVSVVSSGRVLRLGRINGPARAGGASTSARKPGEPPTSCSSRSRQPARRDGDVHQTFAPQGRAQLGPREGGDHRQIRRQPAQLAAARPPQPSAAAIRTPPLTRAQRRADLLEAQVDLTGAPRQPQAVERALRQQTLDLPGQIRRGPRRRPRRPREQVPGDRLV